MTEGLPFGMYQPFINELHKGDTMKEKLIERLLEKALEPDNERSNTDPFEIGKAYLIRTVTYHQVGILKEIIGDFLIFKDASWVADSGRFSDCLSKGSFNEVEFVGPMMINKTAISGSRLRSRSWSWSGKMGNDRD